MTVETFEVAQVIDVTPAAAEHFSSQLKKSGKLGIRISLKESGCTGFKYVIEDVDASEEGDVKIVLENRVNMFIDTQTIAAIKGTQIDYVQQGVNKSLEINNPNVKEACGCGESFSV